MSELSIFGSGSWGTALAVQFARNGHDVLLWSRRPELCSQLQEEGRNELYLPGIDFPETLTVTSDLEAAAARDVALVVVPSHGFRGVVKDLLAARARRRLVLVSAAKGIENDTSARMSQVVWEEALSADREVDFAVLAGPTFAAELARGLPSLGVIASEKETLAQRLQESLSAPSFRLYSSSDVVGVEIGGATKNVIALSSGVVVGLELGQNALAALITRGLHEITRLGLACGGQTPTFSGLAGLGDLVLTCTGGLSRNRRAGLALAEGKTLAEIQASTSMVAEGLYNALNIDRLAGQMGVEMPITAQMVQVLHEGKSPGRALEELMTRNLKAETAL
ncbi:MAG: NAD(P)H-dependent glycerol-3-phosphate dehydrogenase [Acidobacteriota bacterium]